MTSQGECCAERLETGARERNEADFAGAAGRSAGRVARGLACRPGFEILGTSRNGWPLSLVWPACFATLFDTPVVSRPVLAVIC